MPPCGPAELWAMRRISVIALLSGTLLPLAAVGQTLTIANTPYPPNGSPAAFVGTIWAGNDGSGNVTVGNGANIAYLATQQIKLDPGFSVSSGGVFRGQIGSEPPAPPPPTLTITPSSQTITAGGTVDFRGGGGPAHGYWYWSEDGPLNGCKLIWSSGSTTNKTGQFSTYEFDSVGTYQVTIHDWGDANWPAAQPATATITVTPSVAPVITSALTATGAVGSTFNYTVTASNSPISYAFSGAIPAWMNRNEGTITGIPTTAGIFTITISAVNGFGTGSATLTIKINGPPNDPANQNQLNVHIPL